MLPTPPLEQWLAEYNAHLEQVAGLALSTRQGYQRIVRRFVVVCFGSEAPDWQAVTAPILRRLSVMKPPDARALAGSSRRRQFVRFCDFWCFEVRCDPA
jgi:hypothetical protein